jgi:hypothetical protein
MSAATAVEEPVVVLSAARLHELALEAFRVGNRGRLTLCGVLRVLAESRQYYELGHPSVEAYAEAHFQLRRSETREHIRVDRALQDLARLRDAFAAGELGWSVVKAITRVATPEAEEAWLEFARGRRVDEITAEVRDAKRNSRSAPCRDRWGLPNLDESLHMRLSRTDMEKVRRGLGRAAREITERTGQQEVSLEDALVYAVERLLPEPLDRDANAARGSTASGSYAVLYRTCPDCHRAAMATAAGWVEVDREEVLRVEGDAVVETIAPEEESPGAAAAPAGRDDRDRRDRPTPARMRRQVLLRDGQRCANPRCGRRARQCHHIVHLADDGRTELANEVAVCPACHALIHAGLLKVAGTPGEDLRWTAKDEPLTARWRAASQAAHELPVLRVQSAYADSAAAEREARPFDLDDLAAALARQGTSLLRARQLVETAYTDLPPHERTEEAVLRRALRGW